MQTFPIRTYTVIKTETQSILHSPALPRPGVPYYDSPTGLSASRVAIVGYPEVEPGTRATLCAGELRILVTFDEFDRLEQLLFERPKTIQGNQFPYSVVDDPPRIDFVADNETVVSHTLPA